MVVTDVAGEDADRRDKNQGGWPPVAGRRDDILEVVCWQAEVRLVLKRAVRVLDMDTVVLPAPAQSAKGSAGNGGGAGRVTAAEVLLLCRLRGCLSLGAAKSKTRQRTEDNPIRTDQLPAGRCRPPGKDK